MADSISLALHSSLKHLGNKDTYIRLRLINYRSTFSTIIPTKLISKLQHLCLRSTLCNCIFNFLTRRSQSVRTGRISNNNKTEYKKEIVFVVWCKDSNLSLNISKTKELIVNFRNRGRRHAPVYINGAEVEMFKTVKFLGVTITNNLSWTIHVGVTVKKAQNLLFTWML
eukprot:g25982.t1